MMDGVCANPPIKRLGIEESISNFQVNNVYSFSLKAKPNKVKVMLSVHGEDNKMFWCVAEA